MLIHNDPAMAREQSSRRLSLELVMKAVPTSVSRTFAGMSEAERKTQYSKVTFDLFRAPSVEYPQRFEDIRTRIHERQTLSKQEHMVELVDVPLGRPKKSVTFGAAEVVTPANAGASGSDAKEKAKSEYDVDEHAAELCDLAKRYSTHIDEKHPNTSRGLTPESAARFLAEYGPNALLPPKQTPAIVKFLEQFINFFMILLEAAGVLCFVAFALNPADKINLYLGIVLWVIVVVTCLVSFLQDRQSSNIMNSFKNLLPQFCKVVRNGCETKVRVEEVVVGDVVLVYAGDKVPADIRILHSNGLKVDNSSLTGENEPQSCTHACTHANPLESHNMAFYGTLAMDGSAYGLVIRTGQNTLIGKIAAMASESKPAETTLHREIKRFVRFISGAGLLMGAVFFGIGFATGVPVVPNLINVLGIIVANVPEGLPSTVTACLTVTARRLSKRNVYVKQLESVETLGSVTLIASDKTGTLTQNRMTVAHMWYDEEIVKAFDAGTLGRNKFDINNASCKHLLRIAAVSNRAQFDEMSPGNMEKPVDQRLILGDASESSLLRMCQKLEPVDVTRAKYPKIFEIPFNSTNKWQLTIHKQEYRANEEDEAGKSKQQRILMLKGAPEIVFDKCSHILIRGKEVLIDARWRAAFQNAYEALGGMGERVLGFAELYMDEARYGPHYDASYNAEAKNYPTEGLVFVGLASLLDPPRETVPFAVSQCKKAGIKVMMVTGDHPITAKAIAKKVGIISGETVEDIAQREKKNIMEIDDREAEATVVHGSQISSMSDADWDRVLSKGQIVFARTSPQQKSIIVEQCQLRKEVVAVTGDGVNDSPALKKADIGVAMGIVGSDVAKETADVILLDDNFASIVAGIEEGRIIFDNLKKSICYTLAHLIPEILPFLLTAAASLPLALTSVLVLCIDLGTEMMPAVALAYEKGEADVMSRKPRNVKRDRLVTWQMLLYSYLQVGVLEAVACFATFFAVFVSHGYPAMSLFGTKPYFKHDSPDYVVGDKSYDAAHQVNALAEAQSAYFLALVLCQVFNLIACKTRSVSIFKHGISNHMANIAVVASIGIATLLIYIPGIKAVFGSVPVGGIFWVAPLPIALCILGWSELRKWFGARWPKALATKIFLW